MSLFGAAFWSLLAWFGLGLTVAAIDGMRSGAASDIVTLGGCQLLVYSAVLLALVRMYGPKLPLGEFVGLRKTSPLATLGAILLGGGGAPLLEKLAEVWEARVPSDDPSSDAELGDKLAHVPGGNVTLILVLGVVIPIVYEVFYRGAIYGSIRRRTGQPGVRDEVLPVWALIASTALFAASPMFALPVGLVMGLALGWVRQVSGSLWPVLFGRLACALVPLAPLFVGRSIEDDVVYPRSYYVAAAGVAALGALILFSVNRTSEWARDARARDAARVDAGADS